MLEFCFMEVPMEISARSAYDREGRRKYLNRAEGEKFLAQVVQMPKLNALFCLTLYYTGCRISEALRLRQCDFDAEIQTILIRSLKKRGRKQIRRIPIPEFLGQELKNVLDTREENPIWRFSRTTGWRIVKRAMNDAGISGIHGTAKGLRHGFGVRGVLGQVPVTLIQNWMGHADPSTTAIYLAVQDEEERALIERTWR